MAKGKDYITIDLDQQLITQGCGEGPSLLLNKNLNKTGDVPTNRKRKHGY